MYELIIRVQYINRWLVTKQYQLLMCLVTIKIYDNQVCQMFMVYFTVLRFYLKYL